MVRLTLSAPIVLAASALLVGCSPAGKPTPVPVAPPPAPEPRAGTGQPAPAQPSAEAILAGSDLPEPLPSPLANDPLGVTIHRLKNGLTVYISTDRTQPTMSAWVAVRAGSRHDPPNSTGLAHYLEHMLFKGTDELGTTDADAERAHVARIAELYAQLARESDPDKRRSIFQEIDSETQKSAKYAIPNELDQLYARLGVAGVNAFTAADMTVYIGVVPKNSFEAWAKVEGERYRDPVFRLFYPELEAVYEEKNRTLDNPGSRVYEALSRAIFPEHPYGTQPTIGLVEHLKTPAYADMVAYFDRWYVPNNMAILLAGDIDPETALPVIERYFGDFEPKPLTPPHAGKIAPLTGRTQIELTAPGESAVYLSWQTVPVGHPDEPALEVLGWLLDNPTSGLLRTELLKPQILPDAGLSMNPMREAGRWMLQGVARDGQELSQVEQALLAVIAKVKQGEFQEQDLDAIVLRAEMNEMRELESNSARVGKMMGAFIYRRPWAEIARRSERLRRVTRDDVIAAARRYLGDSYVALYRKNGTYAPPKIPKPTITPIPLDLGKKSEFARAIESTPAAPMEPVWLAEGKDYLRERLPAGPMIAVQNSTNELFTVTYLFERGLTTDPLICFALDLWQQSGTARQSPTELARTLFAMGTSVTARCSDLNLEIEVSGIDRNLEASIDLVEEWLSAALLSDDIRAKLVANELSQRKDAMNDPRQIGQALAAFASRHKNSPYLRAPSNQALERAKLPALQSLLATLPATGHKTLYFGPRSAADAAKLVAFGKNHRPTKPRRPLTYRRVSGEAIYLVSREVAQSQISVFLPEPPLDQAARPMAELYTEYVGGGMGALIFQEIREARGLAYSARASFLANERPTDQAALVGLMGTQSDKTVEALATMLALLRRTPIQPERLATAKQTLDSAYRATRTIPRFIGRTVHSWDDMGARSDPRNAMWQAIQAADENALKAFADRFTTGDLIISIVGDKSRMDVEALRKHAPVTEVHVRELFSY